MQCFHHLMLQMMVVSLGQSKVERMAMSKERARSWGRESWQRAVNKAAPQPSSTPASTSSSCSCCCWQLKQVMARQGCWWAREGQKAWDGVDKGLLIRQFFFIFFIPSLYQFILFLLLMVVIVQSKEENKEVIARQGWWWAREGQKLEMRRPRSSS